MRPLLAALIAACTVTTLVAQEPGPAQSDPGKLTHGIIRKPRPKPAGPVAPAPVASTETAAAAIAAAVRNAEDTKKSAPPAPPSAAPPARPATRAAETRALLRGYEVRWPSQRLEVAWDTPDERVTLSWPATGDAPEPDRDGHGSQP
jgi:hypothetical protein